MVPIGSIDHVLRSWLAWHSTREFADHATKLAGEQSVRELRSVVRDCDSVVRKALELVERLEALAKGAPPSRDLRRLRQLGAELRVRMTGAA